MAKLIAACAALAGLSLLLPSEASYDQWAWLVWGREALALELDTTGGPSWKPLPVAFAALVAPLDALGSAVPPALWMVVARTGALLALVFAFRLARRMTGPGLPGIAAGAVAALALALTPDAYQFAAHGSEAPLAVALMLWAIERHLDGRPAHALVLGTLGCLLRPELFLFLAPYAAWAFWARPGLRPLAAGMMLLLPLAWLVPDWLGSGNPIDGAEQARSEPFWSLSHHESPWKRATLRVHNHVGPVPELLTLVAAAVALWRRQAAVLALGVAAGAEVALYVLMTEAGFSGNPRYVLPALALFCVLAGVGAGRLAQAAEALAGGLGSRLAPLGAALRRGADRAGRPPAARPQHRPRAPRGARGEGADGCARRARAGARAGRGRRGGQPLRPGHHQPRPAAPPGLGARPAPGRDRERTRPRGGDQGVGPAQAGRPGAGLGEGDGSGR